MNVSDTATATTAPVKMARVSQKEIDYVMEVLNGQFRNSTAGSMVRRLEERFAETFGVKYALAQINGTATLHSALVAVGVGPGDEVIVPPLTMMSTAFAVMQCGAIPVFADVDGATYTLDPASVRAVMSPRTKAIMPVALYGLSADIDALMATGKPVIEDTAQCFLGYSKGRIAGTIGAMGSYSLQISKHITCGEGGMLVTNDEQLALRARRFGTLGYASVGAGSRNAKVAREVIQDPVYERHVMLGWNYRMPEPSAAIALAQTERLEEFVNARTQCAVLYETARNGCSWLVPQATPDGYVHSWWTYVLRLENGGVFSWYDFRKKYKELGGDGVYAAWQLNHLEPALRGKTLGAQTYERGLCPVAESLQSKLIQFKTNYLDLDHAKRQADVLAATIAFFGR